MYTAVDRQTALADHESNLIRTRWVKSKKGEEVRCLFVAQEIAAGDPRSDLFAGTPPLWAARLLVSMAAMNHHRGWRLIGLDVACAFLYASCERKLFIELPEMDEDAKDGTKIGMLRKALYGTRDAPRLWQKHLKGIMVSLGFCESQLHPCVFWHPVKDIYVLAHVDDLLGVGPEANLRWMQRELEKQLELKGKLLQDGETIQFLGRDIAMRNYGYTWAGDPKHAQLIIQELGLQNANGVAVPVADDERHHGLETTDDSRKMGAEEARSYRRGAARVNYMAQDRPDLAHVANLLSRSMSRPKCGDKQALKRVGRHLITRPRLDLVFRWQPVPDKLQV